MVNLNVSTDSSKVRVTSGSHRRAIGRGTQRNALASVVARLIATLVLLSLQCLQPTSALAACIANSPGGGTTDCSGSPSSFPSGGAIVQGGNANLNVDNLIGNIQPGSGVAGAASIFQEAKESTPGAFPIKGSNGDSGDPGPGILINVQSPGPAFLISTNNAVGIVALSKGQDGQNGGRGVGGAVPCPIPPLFTCPVPGVGGNGGQGGSGGAVEVDTTGSGKIQTTGDNQHGIFALSQGGAGGNGGNGTTLLSIGVGGDGANGGTPSTATVRNGLDIETQGVGAAGIWAQSVGAAGGNGGSADGANIAGFGGDGKAASDGKNVFVENNSTIITHQNLAFGIFAQSVGGFAGSGGGSFGALSFGGNPTSAGMGGNVTVQVDGGLIQTSGIGASAIFAQSSGGGGGAGGLGGGLVGFGGDGSTGGAGGVVLVTSHATINVGGNLASGVFAQSIGGGGGTAGIGAGLVGIGGKGGGGGAGQSVTVNNFGNITVSGTGTLDAHNGSAIDAAGIYAQSIGGGGGNGALGIGTVGVGGNGGPGGAGGNVTVTNNGVIAHTACVNCTEAPTIFAQSIGGGGGDGGTSVGLLAIGGHGAQAGNGGVVTVNNYNSLTDYGDYSAGLFAQSVGGGGGNGGSSFGIGVFASIAVGGSGGAGGNGGNVCVNANAACNGIDPTLSSTTAISTQGYRSAGIFAQSVGGGGGSGGAAISASVAIFGGIAWVSVAMAPMEASLRMSSSVRPAPSKPQVPIRRVSRRNRLAAAAAAAATRSPPRSGQLMALSAFRWAARAELAIMPATQRSSATRI